MATNGVVYLGDKATTSTHEARITAHRSFQRYSSFVFDLAIILEPIADQDESKQLKHALYEVTNSRTWTDFEKASLSALEFQNWLQKHVESSTSELLARIKEVLLKG